MPLSPSPPAYSPSSTPPPTYARNAAMVARLPYLASANASADAMTIVAVSFSDSFEYEWVGCRDCMISVSDVCQECATALTCGIFVDDNARCGGVRRWLTALVTWWQSR